MNAKAVESVRVKVLRGFCLGAGADVYPGDVIDLPKHTAAIEVQKGRVALTDEAIGVASPVQTRAGAPAGSTLAGSAVQPAEIPKGDGKTVKLQKVVETAFKASGLSVDEWNALPDPDREAKIAEAVEKITKKGG